MLHRLEENLAVVEGEDVEHVGEDLDSGAGGAVALPRRPDPELDHKPLTCADVGLRPRGQELTGQKLSKHLE